MPVPENAPRGNVRYEAIDIEVLRAVVGDQQLIVRLFEKGGAPDCVIQWVFDLRENPRPGILCAFRCHDTSGKTYKGFVSKTAGTIFLG